MKRNTFIRSTVLGFGMLSVGSYLSAHNVKGTINTLRLLLKSKILRNGEGNSQIVLGDHQTVKLIGNDTDGLYTLIEQYNEPGMEIPMHIHKDEDEVFHVLEGKLEIKLGEETKVLSAGDIGFCPRGIPHAWKVIGRKKAKVMLSIFPAGLEHMFKELAHITPDSPDFEKISQICEKYNIQFV